VTTSVASLEAEVGLSRVGTVVGLGGGGIFTLGAGARSKNCTLGGVGGIVWDTLGVAVQPLHPLYWQHKMNHQHR